MLTLEEKQAIAKAVKNDQMLWSAEWWVKDGVM
jgi:hypothetical protein